MAYDKEQFHQIRSMSAGDLMHTMLLEFDAKGAAKDPETYMQSPAYNWALERLNEMMPGMPSS